MRLGIMGLKRIIWEGGENGYCSLAGQWEIAMKVVQNSQAHTHGLAALFARRRYNIMFFEYIKNEKIFAYTSI